jgi:hypothetical protein
VRLARDSHGLVGIGQSGVERLQLLCQHLLLHLGAKAKGLQMARIFLERLRGSKGRGQRV